MFGHIGGLLRESVLSVLHLLRSCMNAEKKEGVVIVVVAIALLVVIALLTHWERGFSSAWVGYYDSDSCSGSILICGLAGL
jgi:hypothetical protein